MEMNINNRENNIKKPKAGAIIGGIAAGSAVQSIISLPAQLVSPKIMGKVGDISRNLSSDEFQQVENAVKDTIKTSGLDKKGVSIIKATEENAQEISRIMSKELDNSVLKFLPKQSKDIAGQLYSSQMTEGKNACYTFASKKIIMPEKELGLALFHEAGHAMNANLSTVGKALQKCRPLAMLSIPISLIALFKTKKAEGEEPKNKLDKAATFVKNNAGKLTFAAFLPMLVEEGLASFKGNKFAKQLLSPDLAKKVAKTNTLGFSTYLMMAVLSSVGIFLGTKVKDAIASRKAAETNENK